MEIQKKIIKMSRLLEENERINFFERGIKIDVLTIFLRIIFVW